MGSEFSQQISTECLLPAKCKDPSASKASQLPCPGEPSILAGETDHTENRRHTLQSVLEGGKHGRVEQRLDRLDNKPRALLSPLYR